MPVLPGPEVRRMVVRPVVDRLVTGLLSGRLIAGAHPDDSVRVAGELVAAGCTVALEHVPGAADDPAAEIAVLIGRVHAAGLAGHCELTLPVDRLGTEVTEGLVAAAASVGLATALAGAIAGLPPPAGARIVVPAGTPGAEARCRQLSADRVRLVQARGAAADLSFVRCLNILMAGDGRPAIAATDPRLIAITGERAAWNGRSPDSWEHVLPYGVMTDEQHRLVAAGYGVRVDVPSGTGAVPALGLATVARRLGGRS